MLRLIGAMNMTPGARTWEIGCGLPALAAAISAATSQDVLCTDLDDTYEYICNVSTTEMRLRELAANRRCFELANKLSWEELACLRSTKDKYVPDGPQLLSVVKAKFANDPLLQKVDKLGRDADNLVPQKQRRHKEKYVDDRWEQSPEREVKVLKVVGEARESTEDGDSVIERARKKTGRIKDEEGSGSDGASYDGDSNDGDSNDSDSNDGDSNDSDSNNGSDDGVQEGSDAGSEGGKGFLEGIS
jgi:hypothetical protein